MSDPGRVLIVRLSSIGDVVHALPGLVELRRAWPATRFGWVIEPAAHDLVAALGVDVHLARTPDFKDRPLAPSTWRGVLRLRRELRAPGYEMAIDFQGLLKSAAVAHLAGAPVVGLAPADVRERMAARLYRRHAPPVPEAAHAVERARSLAAYATGRAAGPLEFPRITTDEAEARVHERLARAGIDEFILVHAAANWDSKRYPPERWVEAAREIHRLSGLPLLWVWGPGEEETVRALAEAAGAGSRPSFATTLPELAALVSRARLLVGGDSAPLHIAVACRTPVVGLFGPTDPGVLGPLDPADGVVRRVLPCSHCHRRICPLGTRECLEELPPASIVRAVTTRLGLTTS